MTPAIIARIIGICVGVLLAIVVMRKFWPAHGKMGMNFKKVNCPQCQTPMPRTRAPKSLRQTLWGGWTCPQCGCEMDKYGQPIGDDAA